MYCHVARLWVKLGSSKIATVVVLRNDRQSGYNDFQGIVSTHSHLYAAGGRFPSDRMSASSKSHSGTVQLGEVSTQIEGRELLGSQSRYLHTSSATDLALALVGSPSLDIPCNVRQTRLPRCVRSLEFLARR
jgi:hypothetical protein